MKNIIDEKLSELQREGYGEHKIKLQDGISLTYVNPSPLDTIMSFGKQVKEEIHQKQTYAQELESKKNIENILAKLEKDFGGNTPEQYSNLSRGE